MSSAVTTQVTDLQNYVNGAWRRSTATEYFDVTNPATAELLARTPLSTSADVDAAARAAADAFPAWRRTPPGERVQYLFKLKNLLEESLDDLARVITLENGKTFAEARAELRRAIENVEVACGIPMMMQGYNLEDVTPGVDEMQIRQPLGVVAAIGFVGSTPVARHVYTRSAASGKRMQCQGGAKNHVIVLPDADMELATQIISDSAFGCAGQRCLAVSVAVTIGEAQKTFRDSIA